MNLILVNFLFFKAINYIKINVHKIQINEEIFKINPQHKFLYALEK